MERLNWRIFFDRFGKWHATGVPERQREQVNGRRGSGASIMAQRGVLVSSRHRALRPTPQTPG